MKAGDYIESPAMFPGNNWITAFVCKVNDDGSIDYVRDNLTRWKAGKAIADKAKSITEAEYIQRVQTNAHQSHAQIPTPEAIKKVLETYFSNFDVEFGVILSILDIS